MSDPVSRRARIIDDLLRNMSTSGEGWTTEEVIHFIVKRYRFGIRQRTASDILKQLATLRVLYQKGFKWHVRKT